MIWRKDLAPGSCPKRALRRHAVDAVAAREYAKAGGCDLAVVKERGDCCDGGGVEEQREEQADGESVPLATCISPHRAFFFQAVFLIKN